MSSWLKATVVILCLGLLAALGYNIYRQYVHMPDAEKYPPPPMTLVNDSVEETVSKAAQDGWVPCPGDCLKLATPGWHHEHVEGHPDTDVWFTFRYRGGWAAFSQHHIGDVIHPYPNEPAHDLGPCPVCHGTGWVRAESTQKSGSD